jgi:hypothetical protein
MIKLTVGLPVWNSKKIAWLALESLCNQKNINFDWELIIMEEKKDCFGQDEVSKFITRLKKVGCVSIKYVPLDYKITLPQKWLGLAELAAETSTTFVFCSADDYNEPSKLKTAYEAVKLGYDWVQYQYCLFFDITTKRHVYFDAKSIKRECGNILACKLELIKKIPESYKNKGIDNWIFNTIRPEFIYNDPTDNWKQGFATDGYNNISVERKLQYSKPQLPFLNTDLDIKSIVTKEVYDKLTSL